MEGTAEVAEGFFRGKEIRRLMLISALCCVLMIGSISAYLIISSRQHLESQKDKMETALAEAIGRRLDTSFNSITNFLKATEAVPLSIDMFELLQDTGRLIAFYTGCALSVYDCEYAVNLDGDQTYIFMSREGLEQDGFPAQEFAGMETVRGEAIFKIVDSIPGREGTFILLIHEVVIPTLGRDLTLALVIDATEQVEALGKAYSEDKSDMVGKQVLVSVLIFLGLLALSIMLFYFAIKRRLSDPIDAINASARQVLSGERVRLADPDAKSIFYNLQMLLRSGMVIFEKTRPAEEEGGGRDE